MFNRQLDRRRMLSGRWRQGNPKRVVRPPGAVRADRFQALCDGCAECATACPADAIRMTGPATKDGGKGPEIIIALSPCVICDGLACTTVCPTGALEPATAQSMRISFIVYSAEACLSAQGTEPECDTCFERCPLKGQAITHAPGRGPSFNARACTGCGVCVRYCPAEPKPLSAVAV